MTGQEKSPKTMHIALWTAQVLLAVLLITGAVMKFLPIEKIAAVMPWTGQVPSLAVRLLGVVDLLAAVGLVLPTFLHIKPQLTPWTALCVMVLMLCAISFHVSRGEASVIGVNIGSALIAAFISWGRFRKVPIISR